MPSPIAVGVVFSGMMSKVAVAPFLKKMHEMVEDPATDQVISWSESGESFVVWRQLEFSRDLLPQSFKHNNFASFVRQLSNYGFRKVSLERWEFTNVHFRPGMRRLLFEIKRRRCSPLSFTLKSPPPSPRSSKEEEEGQSSPSNTSTSPRHHNHRHRDLELLVENARLKKQNQFLVSDIERAKERYERLLRLLSNYVDVSDCETLVEKKRKQITESEVAVAEEGGGGNGKRRKNQNAMKLFGVTVGPARIITDET